MNVTPVSQFAWLIRRELWEHRIVVWGPMFLAGIICGAALISFFNGHHAMIELDDGDVSDLVHVSPAKLAAVVGAVLSGIALLFLFLASAQQVFYASDALHSERTQRSILFWKSLPLTDTATVLSKLAVAALVMPAIAWVLAYATSLFVAIVASVQFRASGTFLAAIWNPDSWLASMALSLYVLVTAAIWYLPMVSWMLLVSAWLPMSRGMRFGRSPLLAATLIPVGIVVAERVAFHSKWTLHLLGDFLVRDYPLAAFASPNLSIDFSEADGLRYHGESFGTMALALIHPLRFLETPAVWVGLAISGAFVAGAVYCRRRSENRG